jgi:hypothetical protein
MMAHLTAYQKTLIRWSRQKYAAIAIPEEETWHYFPRRDQIEQTRIDRDIAQLVMHFILCVIALLIAFVREKIYPVGSDALHLLKLSVFVVSYACAVASWLIIVTAYKNRRELSRAEGDDDRPSTPRFMAALKGSIIALAIGGTVAIGWFLLAPHVYPPASVQPLINPKIYENNDSTALIIINENNFEWTDVVLTLNKQETESDSSSLYRYRLSSLPAGGSHTAPLQEFTQRNGTRFDRTKLKAVQLDIASNTPNGKGEVREHAPWRKQPTQVPPKRSNRAQ